MPRGIWTLIALSAAAVAVTLTVVWLGVPGGQESYAQEPLRAYIDKNIDNGAAPCDPNYIDDQTTEVVGSTHELAVCVRGLQLGQPVYGFTIEVRYDDELDKCDELECYDETCLDDNPDANAGGTVWGDGLGEGWHCWPEWEPVCDDDESAGPLSGLAEISCHSPYPVSATLGDDETWGTLAVLTLSVMAAGTDDVIIDSIHVSTLTVPVPPTPEFGNFWCTPEPGEMGLCQGATDVKVPPTPFRRRTSTPTATVTATATPEPTEVPPTPALSPTPTATPTMFGGPGGIVVRPPGTGDGPQGEGFLWPLASILAVAGGAAAAAGGLRLARGSRG